jgi:hypothetical protein
MAVLAEAGGKPEVGDGADMWARSFSDRKRRDERGAGPRVKWTKLGHAEMVRWRASEKRKEEGDLGRASCWATGCFVGRAGRVLGHKCARERERKPAACGICGLRRKRETTKRKGGRLGHAGLRAEKKRKEEMGRVRKKREGEKGGFDFSFFFKYFFKLSKV